MGGALIGGGLIGGALAGRPLVGAAGGAHNGGANGAGPAVGGLTSTRRKMSLGPEGSEVSAPGSRNTMLSVTPGGMRIVKVRPPGSAIVLSTPAAASCNSNSIGNGSAPPKRSPVDGFVMRKVSVYSCSIGRRPNVPM
jgi:hypothetical protein